MVMIPTSHHQDMTSWCQQTEAIHITAIYEPDEEKSHWEYGEIEQLQEMPPPYQLFGEEGITEEDYQYT